MVFGVLRIVFLEFESELLLVGSLALQLLRILSQSVVCLPENLLVVGLVLELLLILFFQLFEF